MLTLEMAGRMDAVLVRFDERLRDQPLVVEGKTFRAGEVLKTI